MTVDAFKLSHHGRRGNVTVDLLKAVQARHYIVSTNGAIFHHPDDEAIARVVIHRGRPATIWFNHDNERSRRRAAPESLARYGYDAKLPAKPQGGVRLELGTIE